MLSAAKLEIKQLQNQASTVEQEAGNAPFKVGDDEGLDSELPSWRQRNPEKPSLLRGKSFGGLGRKFEVASATATPRPVRRRVATNCMHLSRPNRSSVPWMQYGRICARACWQPTVL
jgi:hypothetical protein